jgi:hypothetical protein
VITLNKSLFLQHPQIGSDSRLGQVKGVSEHFHCDGAIFPDHFQYLVATMLHIRQLFAFAFQLKYSLSVHWHHFSGIGPLKPALKPNYRDMMKIVTLQQI